MITVIKWVFGIAIFWFVLSAVGGIGKYEGQTAEYWFNAYDEATAENDDLQTQIEDWRTALDEANNNIEDGNYKIRNAKIYSWESYEEMGDALDSLREIDTVSEP